MKNHHWYLFLLATGAVLANACADDDTQKNPHFSTGGKSSVAGAGKAASGESGAGMSSGGTGEPSTGGQPAATGGAAGDESGLGGSPMSNGGAPEEQPLYDCVLHPKTSLEIINACTDATHIEKHPDLPVIP